MKKLLYDYHKLVERDNSEINGLWQVLHILFLVLIVIDSMVCIVFIGLLSVSFDHNCILFPKAISYKNHSDPQQNETVFYNASRTVDVPVDFIRSQWQDQRACLFPFFNPVMSFIYGIVWITFFLMWKNISKPWRMVIPGFVFMTCYSIFTIINTNTLDMGLKAFSIVFHNMTDRHNLEDERLIHTIDVYTLGSIISGWVFTLLWVGSAGLLVLRCFLVVDFQMIHVKVELIKNIPSSPSMVSEDFSPNESPTFPIHTLSQPPPTHHSPKILKFPNDKPREKKFVNLMYPASIKDSAIDVVGRSKNQEADTNPDTLIHVDVQNQNNSKSEPFTTFTIEPEHNTKDDSPVASASHFPDFPTEKNTNK